MLNLDTKLYSPHSFRRGGATFAFQAGAHPLVIKCLGDWSSDAYLIYLANIFRGRIEYELIYSLRGAKHRVDYSVHIR